MIGIKRLRCLAGAWDEWGLGGALAEIADEIERELDEEAKSSLADYLRVRGVLRDMERHTIGHEGMEDSPVARWARELRDALGRQCRDISCDVSHMTDDDREAAAWVRDHGGLDHVKAEWRSRVPHDRYEQSRRRLLDHIAECETALGRRNQRIEELGHRVGDLTRKNAELRGRAMPEDYEWPRYDTGELVLIGDDVTGPDYEESLHVDEITFHANGFTLREKMGLDHWYENDDRFKRPAVLAADGEPLEVGQTVYNVEDGTEYEVCKMGLPRVTVEYWCEGIAAHSSIIPSLLTHTKPEPPDSWERIEEDIGKNFGDYWGCKSSSCANCAATLDGKTPYQRFGVDNCIMARNVDIIRRCKALAERERGE